MKVITWWSMGDGYVAYGDSAVDFTRREIVIQGLSRTRLSRRWAVQK